MVCRGIVVLEEPWNYYLLKGSWVHELNLLQCKLVHLTHMMCTSAKVSWLLTMSRRLDDDNKSIRMRAAPKKVTVTTWLLGYWMNGFRNEHSLFTQQDSASLFMQLCAVPNQTWRPAAVDSFWFDFERLLAFYWFPRKKLGQTLQTLRISFWRERQTVQSIDERVIIFLGLKSYIVSFHGQLRNTSKW